MDIRIPTDAAQAIAAYIQQHKSVRPHKVLDYDTPEHVYDSSFSTPSVDLDSLSLTGRAGGEGAKWGINLFQYVHDNFFYFGLVKGTFTEQQCTRPIAAAVIASRVCSVTQNSSAGW